MQKKLKITANRFLPFAKWVQKLLAVGFFAMFLIFPLHTSADTALSSDCRITFNTKRMDYPYYLVNIEDWEDTGVGEGLNYYPYTEDSHLALEKTLASTTGTHYVTLNTYPGQEFVGFEYSYYSNGGTCSDLILINGQTSITTVTPYNGQILATSTTNTIGATGEVNDADWNSGSILEIHIENSAVSFQQATVSYLALAQNPISLDFEYALVVPSSFTYSSTTAGLPIGKYWVTSKIKKGHFCLLEACLWTSTVYSTSTTFVISTTTRGDDIKEKAIEYIDSYDNQGSSFDDCTVTSFDFFNCFSDLFAYLFVPTPDAISYMGDRLHDEILTHFPLGYITDFVSILSTTTVGSLTVLSATVPPGIPGTGSHIDLDLTGVLDPYLNATTGAFTNATASSTETLFEITNRYWSYILYLLTILYIVRRILGAHIVPHITKKSKENDN